MNSNLIKNQVENLKLMLLSPKLFITKYFDELINQVDIETIKYQIERKADVVIENYRQFIIGELKKAENESLNRIRPEFKLNDELKLTAENFVQNYENFNDLKHDLHETSIEMKKIIMGNRFLWSLDGDE